MKKTILFVGAGKYQVPRIEKKNIVNIKSIGCGIKPKFIAVVGREAKKDRKENEWITWKVI